MKPAVSDRADGKLSIAAALQEIGILLELKGGRYFQARAYKAAARVLADFESSLSSLIKENRLTAISGIGNAIAAQVKELDRSGTSRMLEQLRSELPRGALELATVPGLSLKKIQQLREVLGISSVAELKSACEKGEVRTVKGFGPKTEQKLLEAVSLAKKPRNEINIHKALRLAEEAVNYLRLATAAKQVEIAGPLRRWRETTPDITIVAAATTAAPVLDRFAGFPMLIRILERTDYSLVAILNTGIKISLLVAPPQNFALVLLDATGSAAHIEKLRTIATSMDLTITTPPKRVGRAPRTKSPGAIIKTEQEVYQHLRMQYVPPELREDVGEIEASLAGKLPEDLVTIADIRGMLHCHTNYSDGKHTVEEMARGAAALGISYLTITDHSPTAFYAGGLKVDRLKRQWEEIARVQETVKVRLLRGTESDILADGSLDYPDRILEQFDVIIASIHSRYRMDENQMTERVTKAMRQPWFKIWGRHQVPTSHHRNSLTSLSRNRADELKSKLTLGIYFTSGGRVYDLNLRHQFGPLTAWIAGFYDPKSTKLLRVGAQYDYKKGWLHLVPSIEAETTKGLSGSLYSELGSGKTFAIAGVSRTNLKPFFDLFWDRSESVQLGVGPRSTTMTGFKRSQSSTFACILSNRTLTYLASQAKRQ